jgi:peptide/nickel transport system permease protein
MTDVSLEQVPQTPQPPPAESRGYWGMVWRQFRKNKLSLVGLAIILLLVVLALAAPLLANDVPIYMVKDGKRYILPNLIKYEALVAENFYRRARFWELQEGDSRIMPLIPYGPENQFVRDRKQAPSRDHWLGTDDRGRDVLTRLLYGTRISISIGFVAVGLAVAIGVFFGALAGYYGKWVDVVILRVIEVVICFPSFFLILALIAYLTPSIYNIMIVIGLTGWTGIARLVRGEFLKLRESDFAMAARASGLRDTRIIFRHLLPNALAPVLVSATFGVAGAILTESALSFLGFGVQPPTPSWGEMLKQAFGLVSSGIWWLVVFPGLAVFVTVTAFNLVGDGLRDAMDPRLRQ